MRKEILRFAQDDIAEGCNWSGTPDREHLWLMAREPRMATADMEALRALALRLGFDTSRLVSQPHGEAEDEPSPEGAAQAASVAAGVAQPASAQPLH